MSACFAPILIPARSVPSDFSGPLKMTHSAALSPQARFAAEPVKNSGASTARSAPSKNARSHRIRLHSSIQIMALSLSAAVFRTVYRIVAMARDARPARTATILEMTASATNAAMCSKIASSAPQPRNARNAIATSSGSKIQALASVITLEFSMPPSISSLGTACARTSGTSCT